MGCKDLMVGDWVYIHEPECKGHRIDSIDELDGQVGADGEVYDECDIRPIPLTEEILEKNGFGYERNVGYIFDDYDGNIVIYDDYNNRLKILQNHDVSFNRECFSKVCVHYLQHALRLCEIRKEIEL